MIPWIKMWKDDLFLKSIRSVFIEHLRYSTPSGVTIVDYVEDLVLWLAKYLASKYSTYLTLYDDYEALKIRVSDILIIHNTQIILEWKKAKEIDKKLDSVDLTAINTSFNQEYDTGYQGYNTTTDATFQKNKNSSATHRDMSVIDKALYIQNMNMIRLDQLCIDFENYVLQTIY